MKRMLFYILALSSLMSGCNTDNGSYAALLYFNDERYILSGYNDENKYTIEKEIGKIARKVKPQTVPRYHLTSNYLEKGTVLFKTKEHPSVFFAKREDRIEVFKKDLPPVDE